MAGMDDLLDFMEDEDGFETPLMPSTAHPEGRKYRIPSPDAKTGLKLAAISDIVVKTHRKVEVTEMDIKRLKINDEDERDFIEQVMSKDVVEEMMEDGVRWEHIKRMSMYAFTLFTVSREAADSAVERGLFKGKALTPTNRAAKRAKSKTASKSTRSDSAASRKTAAKNSR